jgi:hypothetical protein
MSVIWSATDYPQGWRTRKPYCAAFLCFIVRRWRSGHIARRVGDRPVSPAVAGWKRWANDPRSGVLVFSDASKAVPGDIVSFLPHMSHIGIVEHVAFPRFVRTIEANTDDVGGREGDGIWRRTRTVNFCGEFYRLPVAEEAVRPLIVLPKKPDGAEVHRS